MAQSFDPNSFCPNSLTLLKHDTIQSLRCPGCGLENPNHTLLSTTQPIIIADDEQSTRTMPAPPKPRRTPSTSSSLGSSQYVPHALTSGIGERARQASVAVTPSSSLSTASTNHSMIPSTIGIEVRVIHACDEHGTSWIPDKPIGWAVSIANEPMSYDDFVENVLTFLRTRMRRPHNIQWFNPQDPGGWDIALERKPNTQPTYITPWVKNEILAAALHNAHNSLPPPGSKEQRKLTLCFWPATRTRSASPVTQITDRFDDIAARIVDEATKRKDSKSRIKQEIKQEVKQEHKRKRSEGSQRRADAEEGRGLTGRPGEREGLRSSST